MRLIDTTTLAMETHYGRDIPPYAILSHTWEDEEVTLQDWNSPTRNLMKGFHKIRMTCWLAARKGIEYAWVDTCCIDKTNSAELSEAINSMYRWYKSAKVCYAYLSDLHLPEPAASKDSRALEPFLRKCRWFSRGWTLQELIAPTNVLFYQHDWGFVGTKKDWKEMLSDVTGISPNAIQYYQPRGYSIAERMSWAGGRETTREEDMAYCLVGIFDVNMPMLYGEGTKAFRRLQEEIIRTRYDVSIFAWTKDPYGTPPACYNGTYHCSAFAEAPGEFHFIPAHLVRRHWNEVSVTNAGVKLTLDLDVARMDQTGELSFVLPVCISYWRDYDQKQRVPALGVELRMISPGRFVRQGLGRLVEISDRDAAYIGRRIYPNAYFSTDVDNWMLMNLSTHGSYCPCFKFPPHCRVVKAWPSVSWSDVESKFMTKDHEPSYGSFLLETQSSMVADDGVARQCRTGEFMFLFSETPGSNYNIDVSDWDLQFTIVGYREYQSVLDSINLRIGAGDIDVPEMRRTLRNFAIPRQRTAAVPVDEPGQYTYTSVEVELVTVEVDKGIGDACSRFRSEPRNRSFVFKSLTAASENEQQP